MKGLLLAVLLLFGGRVDALQAQAPAHSPAAKNARERKELGAPHTERLRARWSALPAEERSRLESRLRELEDLPPSERRELLERARVLRERERLLFDTRSDEFRSRLEELGPERGREVWKQHVRERFRERGREFRQRMPEELCRRLEQAPNTSRPRMLERLSREREPMSRFALRRLGARLELSEEELRRLENLPVEERMRRLQDLKGALERRQGAARHPRPQKRSAPE